MITGNVHKYPDNVDTDAIIPARHMNSSEPKHLASHCMEDIDAEFVNKVKSGDVIVAGFNFGCGSSREHAPVAIKASGVSCVIAKSFARIFFRNSINIGLPIIECEQAAADAKDGDVLEVDIKNGKITNMTQNKTYSVPPFPEKIREIIERGGLIGR